MSFSQWTFLDVPAAASLDTVTVIEGSSTLRFRNTGATIQVGALTSGAALTTGKVRTLFRMSTFSTDVWAGVFGMMQTSITNTSNCYSASVTDNELKLFKGQAGAGATQLGSTVTVALSVNTVYAIQLQWQLDPDSGFVVLNVALDQGAIGSPSTYDFSTLTTKITHTDTSSPFSSAVSAGVFHRVINGGGNMDAFFDKTQILKVAA